MSGPGCRTIVVTIDGLRAAALGAYGQTASETPAFDALAVESRVGEWCYAPTADRREVLEVLSQCVAEAVVITDDPALAEQRAAAHLVATPAADRNAASIELTRTAFVWSAFAERLAESADGPRPLWFHATGMRGPWDAPTELWAPLVDEEDSPVDPGVAPPDAFFDDPQSEEACEARFAASCRYAAEVMTLDACLAAWLDVFDAAFEGEDARLIVAGLRGYPLGEHGRVGGEDDRLFSESQHVPLFVRDPDPASRFSRDANPQTLPDALDHLLAGQSAAATARLRSASADALVTEEWMLRRVREGEAELYVKPDDRWEQNDVASLEEATTEALLAELAEPSGVATATDEG